MVSSLPVKSEVFYLDGVAGRLLVCLTRPVDESAVVEAVLHAPAFGEEMNKSRRMVAVGARALAAHGVATMVVDLHGCGDSSGDFAEASMAVWLDDLERCFGWLSQLRVPVSVWGLRMGALLAATLLAERKLAARRLVMWQMVARGEAAMNEFLRLKVAADMLGSEKAQSPAPTQGGSTKAMRAKLSAGESIEIGGYELNGALAAGLFDLRLDPNSPPPCMVVCLEVVRETGRAPLPATRRIADGWRAKGAEVQVQTVVGEPFWRTLEIAECRSLVEATVGVFVDEASSVAEVAR